MKKSHLLGVVCTCIIVSISSSVGAAIVASSSFDSGADGWTWTAANDSAFSWQSTGGNPGGYIHFDDNLHTNIDVAWLNAPSEYLGNWSSLGITQLSFEFNIFQLGGIAGGTNYSVMISGPGGDALWTLSPLDAATPWKNIITPINEVEWTINNGTWNGILANVETLSIALEVVTSSSPAEITGVDNVSLSSVPIPPAFFLFGSGLLGLIGIARIKKT